MLAAALPAFTPHADVLTVVGFIVVAYATALTRLGPRLAPPGEPVATRFQLVCFGLATFTILLVSCWPVHDVADESMYSVHMVEHLSYMVVAAPLLLLGTPTWLARWVLGPRWLFRTVRVLAGFLPAVIVYNVVLVVVHWPAFVDLTLRWEFADFFSHSLLLVSALVVWMPILSPVPEIPRLAPMARMVFLFLMTVVPTIPASFLTFGSHPLYRRYETFPKLWGISALDDQLIAGLIMKIGMGLLLSTLIAVIFFRWVATEDPVPRAESTGLPSQLTEVKA